MAAPWKQLLLKAIESNSHLKHSSFFQLVLRLLATVRSDGRPANRTVVFRGFEEGTDKIQINTDRRSHKIEELKHCPFAEICWYFTDTWEQFRLVGKVEVIDGTNSDSIKLQLREKSWFSSSLKSRLQYLGSEPGLPSTDEVPTNNSPLDPLAGPFDAFCLLVLDPDQLLNDMKISAHTWIVCSESDCSPAADRHTNRVQFE
ncbi:hypothetical protein V2J09_001526 [Rumex salicifolius]